MIEGIPRGPEKIAQKKKKFGTGGRPSRASSDKWPNAREGGGGGGRRRKGARRKKCQILEESESQSLESSKKTKNYFGSGGEKYLKTTKSRREKGGRNLTGEKKEFDLNDNSSEDVRDTSAKTSHARESGTKSHAEKTIQGKEVNGN